MAKNKKNLFERFANWATAATGSSAAFIIAMCNYSMAGNRALYLIIRIPGSLLLIPVLPLLPF
jgi:hypothetical protein